MKNNILMFVTNDDKKDKIVNETIKQAKLENSKVIIFHLNEEELVFAGYDLYIEPRTFLKNVMLGTDLQDIEDKLNKEQIENELVIMNALKNAASVYHQELSEKYDPKLIILGYNKENVIDKLLGSTCENIIKYSNCPVLVIK